MGLPATIRVKISSEAAEYMSLTPVVVREMEPKELIEAMLGTAGKNVERIRDLLRRGTLVSGASRLRWEGIEAEAEAIGSVLATFPDPEPGRPFAAESCMRAILKGAMARVEITREVGRERRLLRRECFWNILMEIAAAGTARYAGYSYKDRADHYTIEIPWEAAARLRDCAGMIRYSTLEGQVRRLHVESLEVFVERTPAAL